MKWPTYWSTSTFVPGTCNSVYVGGSGSGFTPCPAGKVFTSSNGNSTTVDAATCCDSTCDSEYVGGSGSGSTPCPVGQVFTSSNGASTTVDAATCCDVLCL